jgi:hypothetical protein
MSDAQYDEIRRKVEKRYKERRDLIIHFIAFVVSNLLIWGMWLLINPAVVAVSAPSEPTVATSIGLPFPWPLFITGGWLVGIVSHFLSYYFRYGAGANQREDAIEREVEAELARRSLYEKPKNDSRIRISEDGELEEVDDLSEVQKQKHSS